LSQVYNHPSDPRITSHSLVSLPIHIRTLVTRNTSNA
jgi:hypothetical protein